MLQLTVNNTYIDFGSDIAITIVKKSPIFFENDGGFAYNFTLPRTPLNNRILLTNQGDKLVRILFNGELLAEGIMLVKEKYADTLNVSCGIDKGSFNYRTKNTSIASDIYEFTEDIPAHDNQNDANFAFFLNKFDVGGTKADLIYPTLNYQVFPFWNDAFYDGADFVTNTTHISKDSDPSELEVYIGHVVNYLKQGRMYLQNYNTDESFAAFNPSFFAAYIIDEICKYAGVIQGKNFIKEDEELKRLVILHNADMRNNNVASLFSYTLKPCYYLPDISIMEFCNQLAKYFCGWAFVKNNTLELIKFDDIFNSTTYKEFSSNITSIEEIILAPARYTISENSDSSDSYKSDLRNNLKTSEVKGVVANIAALNTITGILNMGIYYVEQTHAFFMRKYSNGNYFNEFIETVFFDYNIGNLENEQSSISMDATSIEMASSSNSRDLYMTEMFDIDTYWYIPRMKIKADYINSDGIYEKGEDKTLRLLFYRGIQPDLNDYHYPMASSDIYNSKNQKITDANYSLGLYGENGRYEQFFKKYIYWLLNIRRDYKLYKYLTPKEFKSIDFSEKHRINGFNHLLKSVQVTVTMNKIQVAEIESARI